jgi:exosortase
MLKEMFFPVGYLLFMIPLPYIIIKTISVNLRLLDANVTYSVLNFLGIPIFQDGVNLELPQMSLQVADLCTGILSLVAIMAITVLYAYLTQKRLICRIALIILAVPIAVISNMFRLVTTVGLVYFYGSRVLGDAIHEFHGTVNFLVTVFFVVLAGKLISKIDNRISNKWIA